MDPLISVIMPCYNIAKYLPRCMHSLINQTIGIHHMQLIFIDDVSTDDGATWEMILSFEKMYPEEVVAVSSEKNRRAGGARNVGLMYASAPYVAFLDPDDWIDPQMYETLYRKMIDVQADFVACSAVVNTSEGLQYECGDIENLEIEKEKSIYEGGDYWIHSWLQKANTAGLVLTSLFRKNLILENQIFFPEHLMYDDNYWQSVFLLYVKKACHVQGNWYHYFRRTNSITQDRNNMTHFDRLKIEMLKIQKYQELGLFDRYYREIESDFLGLYYLNTLYVMYTKFDTAPFEKFEEMTETIMQLFPHFRDNPYIPKDDLNWAMLDLIDKGLNKEQFLAVGEVLFK